MNVVLSSMMVLAVTCLSANSNVSTILLSFLTNGKYELAALDILERWGKDAILPRYLVSRDLSEKIPGMRPLHISQPN